MLQGQCISSLLLYLVLAATVDFGAILQGILYICFCGS